MRDIKKNYIHLLFVTGNTYDLTEKEQNDTLEEDTQLEILDPPMVEAQAASRPNPTRRNNKQVYQSLSTEDDGKGENDNGATIQAIELIPTYASPTSCMAGV